MLFPRAGDSKERDQAAVRRPCRPRIHLWGVSQPQRRPADRISAPQQLDLLLPKLSPRALILADNALSHPDQIAAYLTKVRHLEHTTHSVLSVGKGLSVAWRELPGQ